MGKLIPRCFAANSDTVYFLARAVSTNDKTGPEMVALVKSDPYPASIQEAKWTVVNNTTSRFFSSWYNRYYMSGDLSCTVDDNGVFIFTGQYSSNGARSSYRYDPLAPRDTNHKTTINGTTLSVRYGSDKLWAVMETGIPYYARMNNYTYAKYHRTLAVFPFTAPYTVTSPPASVVTAPWDLTCEYYYEVQTVAVFGGKIYYVCQSENEKSVRTGHLYTYDSATSHTLGPIETGLYCTGKRSLTLVPGKPGVASPVYGLVSNSDSFGVLDLSPENYGRCTDYKSDSRNLFRVDDMIEAPMPDPPECLETCTEMRALGALFGGIFGGIAVLLICCCLTIRHCTRKKARRQREMAALAVAVAAASEEVALHTIEEQHPPPPYKRDPTE
ncbi:hypothetical protein BG006_006093 [Podila minutissima]|uniref:Uncharacterized protein n=1 Tax=Podila minutissima TaxID=64525 RepID=A0A9P5SLP5_9FUNG|nr:hypothetical protein BG006_006093 [Podila minutissima]